MSRKQRAIKHQPNSNVTTFRRPVKKQTVELKPKSLGQEKYIADLLNDDIKIVLAVGPAGTGKTLLAMLAAIKAYKEGKVEKIVLTRPAIGTDDEQHGFLPGDINAKMEPWTRPLFDVLHEFYSPQETARMLDEQIIEISPLAFMRGRSFKAAYIVLDEAQNTTVNQIKMLMTRPGNNCKVVITGDTDQTDIHKDNGLKYVIKLLSEKKSSMITLSQLSNNDIQRSDVVQEVLRLFNN